MYDLEINQNIRHHLRGGGDDGSKVITVFIRRLFFGCKSTGLYKLAQMTINY